MTDQLLHPKEIRAFIDATAQSLGFTEVRVGKPMISEATKQQFNQWLQQDLQGTMDYMQRHADLRVDPSKLHPGTLNVISVRLPYWPEDARDAQAQLSNPKGAYISRYALGRDYHKVIRTRLQKMAEAITAHYGSFEYRAFSDSAPIMEVALAKQAGLGWQGKHTLSLSRNGSWYFLGELFTNLPLEIDAPISGHCGTCKSCIDACPTQAITQPYQVDARRCISYLTIEHEGEIPVEFRKAMGNRIYGCDDCQLVCPWNQFTQYGDPEFLPRHALDKADLISLFKWCESEFLSRFEGSPIRRIGYERWQRNIAVALGNAPTDELVITTLQQKITHASALIKSHIEWALAQHAVPN